MDGASPQRMALGNFRLPNCKYSIKSDLEQRNRLFRQFAHLHNSDAQQYAVVMVVILTAGLTGEAIANGIFSRTPVRRQVCEP